MAHPYEALPEQAFWRSAVAQRHFSEIEGLWSPKFAIDPQDRLVTFGSCFAQNISRALRKRGYDWLSTEPPPPLLSEAEASRFNYNVYSCRTANIFTTSLLLQWTRWAFQEQPAPAEAWRNDDRYFDPFRPTIEPGGFESADEMLALREVTIRAFAEAVTLADVFVFTLGLTEGWRNKQHGYEYQMCPGTAAGDFDATSHRFDNADVLQVIENLREVIDLMRAHNRNLRFLLTVSPVPLTATNSDQHVMVATLEAKSILRAAASQMARYRDFVDYLPSYEIISSPVMQGAFFAPNKREVAPMGVEFVMNHFFSQLQRRTPAAVAAAPRVPSPVATSGRSRADLVCEEELLAAFGPSSDSASRKLVTI